MSSSTSFSSFCYFALIHNNHSVRNEYVMPRLLALCRELQAKFVEASWQPPLELHSYSMALRRDFTYGRLEWQWARYRGLSAYRMLRIATGHVRHTIGKYLTVGKKLASWRRRSFIETIVTAKHIYCWQTFLESDAQFLICCEDDIVFKDDSSTRLRGYLESLDARSGEMVYADLAGGVSVDLLNIARVVEGTRGDMILFKRPTTNTACSYLLSRGMVEDFVRQIDVQPSLRLIGIDWMMNAMFIDQQRRGKSCTCVHFSPTIFRHGTFTGEYVSWQSSIESK